MMRLSREEEKEVKEWIADQILKLVDRIEAVEQQLIELKKRLKEMAKDGK